jgi:purine-binding chemotaxis protein CheW
MKEHRDTDANAPPPQDEPQQMRELLLLRAGGQAFAVFAEEAEGVTKGHTRTPLPHAPRAVLGLVCVRGRMLTLLDPLALAGVQDGDGAAPHLEDEREESPRFVIALRGDEQLALAADDVEGTLEVPAGALDAPDYAAAHALRATLERGGALIHVLDPTRLFDAAMQGVERRRRRQ